MKTFTRYLKYRLENSVLRTLVFTLLSVILTQTVISECIGRMYAEYNETGIYVLAVVLGVFCTLIPMLELAGFKNRRNLDTLYFFPIKRVKMAAAHYISGFIQVFIIYSVTFFVAYAHLALQTNYFALEYMIIYYFLSLLVGLAIYSIFAFIFLQANSVADGVLFSVLWMFVLALVLVVVQNEIIMPILLQENEIMVREFVSSGWGIIYAPINNLTVIFQDLIEVNRGTDWDYLAEQYRKEAYMFFIWGAIGIAAAVGYFVTFVKKGAHQAGEISESPFGYKMLIPVYGYMLMILLGSEDIILTALIFALMIIGYIIYRRGFKFKTGDLVATGCGILALIVGTMI